MVSKGKKVFVGVSGGVDSSVALALLKRQGYDVTGVFLRVWNPDFLECNWREERRDAMRVCATLGVPFITLDCQEEYKKEVADYMINEYRVGRTPNPDVFCNKYVKFGVFLKKALEMGADYVATGHYAVVHKNSKYFSGNILPETEYLPAGKFLRAQPVGLRNVPSEHSHSKDFEFFELHESVDKNKDQSYFLYTLSQDQLSHILFPIGGMTKPEVRTLAEKFGLPTATKKDSQGVCFLGKLDMKEFLAHYISEKPGDVLNTKGEVIGKHNGAIFSTIGERHGFEIIKKTANSPKLFVVSKDLEKNTITVADKETEKETVFSTKKITVKNLHFISGQEPAFPFVCSVRIRYRQEKQRCTVTKQDNEYCIDFEVPQNGVAVGQSAVLYTGEVCLGGGIIEKVA
ncbi:MAG: tRNA 2-thiouridine(34) synthase MnmA [bacterium]